MLVVQGVKGVTDAFHSGFLPALYVDDNMVDKTKMGIFFGEYLSNSPIVVSLCTDAAGS